jgi:hypothetical protein
MDKKLKKQLRRESEMVQRMSLEEWEEANLENHSYYDIDILENANRETNKRIEYWQNYNPSTWIGKWWKQIQINRYKKKLKHYVN